MLHCAERARMKAHLDRAIVAFEPTSHFWMLIANDLEARGVDYLVVHPISVWRGREIREYSYAKDDFRDASLIAELAAQLHFTQARLKDPLWQTMRSLAKGFRFPLGPDSALGSNLTSELSSRKKPRGWGMTIDLQCPYAYPASIGC